MDVPYQPLEPLPLLVLNDGPSRAILSTSALSAQHQPLDRFPPLLTLRLAQLGHKHSSISPVRRCLKVSEDNQNHNASWKIVSLVTCGVPCHAMQGACSAVQCREESVQCRARGVQRACSAMKRHQENRQLLKST